MICAPSEDSTQPGHPPSLIRVFAVRSMGSHGPNVSSCGQRWLWSDWADVQADLSLRWAQLSFWWFCHEAAQMNHRIRKPWQSSFSLFVDKSRVSRIGSLELFKNLSFQCTSISLKKLSDMYMVYKSRIIRTSKCYMKSPDLIFKKSHKIMRHVLASRTTKISHLISLFFSMTNLFSLKDLLIRCFILYKYK